jgi:hypothetical protein
VGPPNGLGRVGTENDDLDVLLPEVPTFQLETGPERGRAIGELLLDQELPKRPVVDQEVVVHRDRSCSASS